LELGKNVTLQAGEYFRFSDEYYVLDTGCQTTTVTLPPFLYCSLEFFLHASSAASYKHHQFGFEDILIADGNTICTLYITRLNNMKINICVGDRIFQIDKLLVRKQSSCYRVPLLIGLDIINQGTSHIKPLVTENGKRSCLWKFADADSHHPPRSNHVDTIPLFLGHFYWPAGELEKANVRGKIDLDNWFAEKILVLFKLFANHPQLLNTDTLGYLKSLKYQLLCMLKPEKSYPSITKIPGIFNDEGADPVD